MQTTLKFMHPIGRALVIGALVLSIVSGTYAPAMTDTAGQTSTRNIILGGLAVAAGIILYNNYEHKVAYANSIVGRTSDGGIVYGDGRIVYPNNITAYATNNGTQVCTFNGVGVPCRPTHMYGYFRRGYKPACWPPGHCKDYWKHHHHDNDQGNDNQQHD